MGIFRRIRDALFMTAAAEQAQRFSIGPDSIPPEFFGISAYEDETVPLPRVSRRAAMQVPGVKRGRDLICAPIGGLRLGVLNAQLGDVTNGFLQQPERDVPRSITYTRLVEDLLFEQHAWWRITEQDYRGFPMRARRLHPRSVDTTRGDQKVWVRKDGSVQGDSWEWVPDELLIRFDSPTDGILTAGAGAIRTVLALDRRAYRSANNPVPDGYFTPYGDIDPFEDDDPTLTEEERANIDSARNWLRQWAAQRRESSQAYVPAGLKYEQLAWDPKQLQLAEARQHAILEVVRLMGLEPEDLGVPVTSRTYFNAETKRRDRIDFTLGMFIDAIQDRLSMGDVTPRGQLVRFNINDFVRSDTLARYQSYDLGLRVGAIADKQEVRALEGGAPLTPEQLGQGQSQPTAQEVPPVTDNVRQLNPAAARPTGTAFAAGDLLIMSAAPTSQAFRVDAAKRQITGLVVPYGGARAFSKGNVYEFSKGSIAIPADPTRVKMFINHDDTQAVGHAASFDDTDAGLVATFQLDRSPEADRALQKAEDRVWDGLSGGFRQGGKFQAKDGVQFAVSAPLGEVSLCPSPAFDDARVSAVALSADTGGTMECEHCGHVHAAGVTTCDPQAVAAFAARRQGQTFNGQSTTTQLTAPQQQAGPPAGTTGQVQLSESSNQQAPEFAAAITNALTAGFQQLANQMLSQPQREFVSATGGAQSAAQFQVREELPYRFNGSTAGEHCFTDDLRDSWMGSHEAKARLETFLTEAHEQFAVTTTNVAGFNPVQNRPELYVPSLQFQRPLWDMVSNGTIDNITAFSVPKFGAASGLVGPHTQGTEPTPGAFSATVQQVTPIAISGKVEINREVWDQGGNPQTDTIVWQEMQNAYWEAAETRIATLLNGIPSANLYSGNEINLASAVDGPLDTALTNLLSDLQFARGGNRYTQWASDAQLYKALVGAKDSSGRKLYPLLGPTNANGQVEPGLAAVSVGGQTIRPAWALAQGIVANAQNSYAFVKGSVWAWLSSPKRFTFEYQTKSVDMAVWGYAASASLRDSDIIRIDYTTLES